jgi:hypothetical protein
VWHNVPMASCEHPSGRARCASTVVAWILACWLVPTAVVAQQRPLQTQDPEPIGTGKVLVGVGFDHGTDVLFPASGLAGSLTRVPVIGLTFGISPIAEIELTGGPYQRLDITHRYFAPLAGEVTATGGSTHSVVDVSIGAKVRLLRETAARPAVAFLFSTSLPNAKHPSGLGLNTTNFFTGFAVAKTLSGVRVAGNIGLGILPSPVDGQSQNDVLTYGLSLTRRVGRQVELVGELAGRSSTRSGEPPPGTGSRRSVLIGGRYFRGAMRLDGGMTFGMTELDATFGVTAGVSWMFKAWSL